MISRSNYENEINNTMTIEKLKTRIRQEFIESKVDSFEREFSKYSPFRIWAGTWNVNGKFVEEEVRTWIRNEGLKLFDMYVFGLEELVPLTLSSILLNFNVDYRMNQWIDSILSILKSIHGVSFRCIAAQPLVGTCLIVVVPSTSKHHFSSIQKSSLSVGYYGLFGNKGAVAASITVDDTPLHFVCCHLSPHQHNEQLRNSELARIFNEIEFTSGSLNTASSIVLVGDLNYRLNSTVPRNERIAEYLHNPLFQLETDQLLQLMKSHPLLAGFSEESIQFQPTYKYKPQSDVFDGKRDPAWCDRILFKGTWSCKNYRSAMKTNCSDHKAITASLETETKIVNKSKREDVKKRLEQEILQKEGNSQLIIERPILDFKTVCSGEKVVRLLVIENKGDGNGYYQILPTSQTKEWFSIHAKQGLIEPHSKKEVEVTLRCSPRHIRWIHRGWDVVNSNFLVHLIGQEMKEIECKGTLETTSWVSKWTSPSFWFWGCLALAVVFETIHHWYHLC